jgi:alpha/beta hydrolase fold
MRFVHDRDKRLAFPFKGLAFEDAGMPPITSILSQHADLHLRRGVDVQVMWPPATPETPALLVVLPGESADAAIWHELCVRIPAVVLAVPTTRIDHAREALEWGADHAGELGADPRRLLLAADHGGAGLIAALARHARDRGWPRIARHVLIDPELGPARLDQLVGLLEPISRREATRAGTRAASGPGSRARSAASARRTGGRR